MAVVVVPMPYRGPTRGRSEIEVKSTDVGSALREVEELYPGFEELVFDKSGVIHRFVKLFINQEQIDTSEQDKPLGRDDRLEILAAIAGG